MLGFSSGSVVKNLPANAGDSSSISGSGRVPGEENGNPLQYSCLGNPMDRAAWWATAHGRVTKELDMTWELNNKKKNILKKPFFCKPSLGLGTCPTNSSCLNLHKLRFVYISVSSLQWDCYVRLAASLPCTIVQKAWEIRGLTKFVLFFSGIRVLSACCSVPADSCFTYFVQFSSYLLQGG